MLEKNGRIYHTTPLKLYFIFSKLFFVEIKEKKLKILTQKMDKLTSVLFPNNSIMLLVVGYLSTMKEWEGRGKGKYENRIQVEKISLVLVQVYVLRNDPITFDIFFI